MLGRVGYRSANPLEPVTVVVPNPLVGQWLEQHLARHGGAADGVTANLDVILPATFIGRALYDDPNDLSHWTADGFAIGMLSARREPRDLSVAEAVRRGQNLADVLYWRPDEFGAYLKVGANTWERAAVQRLEQRGVHSPWASLENAPTATGKVFGENVILFDCGELSHGALLARAVERVGATTSVNGFLVAPPGFTVEHGTSRASESSLVERWSTRTAAHLRQWRENCPSAQWRTVPSTGRPVASGTVVERLTAPSSPSAHRLTTTPLLEVHGAIGYARQVEIAREAILTTIHDAGIAPHDVRVVTTDAERFVPLVNEYWSHHGAATAPRLQFEVADPSLTHPSDRLRGFTRLLETIASHFTLFDLVTLLSEPSIQRGIGLSRRDVERVLELAVSSGVNLGLDGRTRESVGAFDGDDDAGTWGRFRDRGMLASVYDIDEGDAALTIWPIGVPADLPVMAELSQLLSTLTRANVASGEPRTITGWTELFTSWAALVASPVGVIDVGLNRAFERLHHLAQSSEGDFTFDEVRELFERSAATVGGSSVVGRGGVTIQDPYALSHAPYRVTCILGLDDELLPGRSSNGAHLGAPRPGDPSPRERFRAALVSLLVTTTDRVIILTNDREVSDGSALPPPLALAELIDALAIPDFDGVGLKVDWRRHPRYAFSTSSPGPEDERSSEPDLVLDDDAARVSFSLDPIAAELGTLLYNKPDPTLDDDLAVSASMIPAVSPPPTIELRRLIRFIGDPQRSFLATVFNGAAVPEQRPELPDVPALDLDNALWLWNVRRTMVERALETGMLVEPGGHLDDAVASVAAGFRDRVRHRIDVSTLVSFVDHHRRDLAVIAAVRAPWSRRPADVPGLDRRVTRPAIEVYDTGRGPTVVQWTVSKSFTSSLVHVLITMAAATAESGAPVSAVLVRPDYGADPYQGNPYVTMTWRPDHPVRSAVTVLNELTSLYLEQFEAVPLHFLRTSFAESPSSELEPIFGSSPSRAWEGGAYRAARGGERANGANQLLLPFSFEEIRELSGHAFRDGARRLQGLFDDVMVTSSTTNGPAWSSGDAQWGAG